MKPLGIECCDSCCWYHHEPNADLRAAKAGECRLSPPTSFLMAGPKGVQVVSGFSQVQEAHWCGQYSKTGMKN